MVDWQVDGILSSIKKSDFLDYRLRIWWALIGCLCSSPPRQAPHLPLRAGIIRLHRDLLPREVTRQQAAMGRYNFAPQRVHQAASRLLQQGQERVAPPWYHIVGTLPPSERLVRPPLQPAQRKGRKASKLFKPIALEYQEDKLRFEFFGDHPWELARPRQILEEDGKDYQKFDWSQLEQSSKQVDGERYAHKSSPASIETC